MRVWREGLCSCARVKSAPTSGFCEDVCNADACAEYECERLTDARMLHWLMRTREERADVWILRGLMRTREGRTDVWIFAKACV